MKPSDHVFAVIKAGINCVPVIGGAVASLIGDYIPSSTQRGIEVAIADLQSRLSLLQNRIDVGAIDQEQLSEVFKSAYLVIVRTHDQRRRHAAVSAVVNALLQPNDPEKVPYTELDHFVRALDTLSIGALDVVQQVVRMAQSAQGTRLGDSYWRFNFADLQRQMPGLDRFLLLGLIGELNAVNFVHQPGLPTIRQEPEIYSNYPLELTPLGVRFVARLMEELVA